GKGPIIVEFLTYRYRGHSMSDPAKYRSREEVQDVREHRDPISHAERELEKMGIKEEELKAIDKEIKDIVVGAAKFAEDAPEPPPSVHVDRAPVLPPSLRPGTLSACAPPTLEAAERCLTSALSAEDLAIVQDRLTDPNAPMTRVMREKLGIDNADFAAGMIISDIQSRAMGIPLDFDQLRQRL